MAEGDGRHRCVRAQGRFERLHQRRELGVDPELVVNALNQLPARSQSPRELREDLVLLVGPRELRVGARLTVVVAQILVSREEPQPIANDRTTEVRREVAVPGALVSACPLAGTRNEEAHRLAGQARRLPVVRRVIQKPVAALPGDDVDDGALHVAELGGRPDRLDLYFLNEVDARLGSRDAVARAGEVRAVDEKLVLVGAGAERGHEGVRAASRRGGRDAGGGPDEVEHARPSRRDRFEVLGAEASPESAASCFDARARSLDHDRFREACQLQDSRSLDGGACPDADVLFVVGRKSLHLDVEHVRSRRQSGEAQLPFLVRGQRRRAANQRRRADANGTGTGRTPPCASLTVPMRAPVNPCAAVTRGHTTHAAAHNRNRLRRNLFFPYFPPPHNSPF